MNTKIVLCSFIWSNGRNKQYNFALIDFVLPATNKPRPRRHQVIDNARFDRPEHNPRRQTSTSVAGSDYPSPARSSTSTRTPRPSCLTLTAPLSERTYSDDSFRRGERAPHSWQPMRMSIRQLATAATLLTQISAATAHVSESIAYFGGHTPRSWTICQCSTRRNGNIHVPFSHKHKYY